MHAAAVDLRAAAIAWTKDASRPLASGDTEDAVFRLTDVALLDAARRYAAVADEVERKS